MQTKPIHELLLQLGITPNYTGFFFTVYAVQLCMERPQRLLMVTKWVYPDVAKHFNTNSGSVERNIRTVIDVAQRNNPQFLSTLARRPLTKKPCVSEFLGILSSSLMLEQAA